ncbi:MAG: hypothetical protein KF866_01115 [Phycisphaeraceae bacterium]|nr:hypothetical protein [Phycisphaeraceae bacterium]
MSRWFLSGSVAIFASAAAVCACQGQVVSSLGDSVWRFDASEEAKAAALPSMSFENPALREKNAELSVAPLVIPRFGRDEQGRITVHIDIEPGTSLYGVGSAPGQLLRNGTVHGNTGVSGEGINATSRSLSHPWVLAVRPNGSSFGVLADTTYRSTFDLRNGILITAEGPEFPVIIIDLAHPELVVRRLSDFIGRAPMPPRWALGYHQSGSSFTSDSRVRQIAAEFRAREIPCDVLWLDINFTDSDRAFTFSPKDFPDPDSLNADLRAMGFKTVWKIDSGIKAEPGYFVFEQGKAIDAWVKQADRTTDFAGDGKPSPNVFPDFTSNQVRHWWAGLLVDFVARGIDGVWSTSTAPAASGASRKAMPKDNWHNADPAFGGPGTHDRFHNVYDMLMARAIWKGIRVANPDKRPFVVSRANFIGGHRYAATLSDNNLARWDHMEWSVPTVLNLGLSGQPFSGPVIGGSGDDVDGKLFARWIGIASLMPFVRGHTALDTIDNELWAFGPEVEATARRALERRSLLLPYLYTAAVKAAKTGTPIICPLFFVDPADPALRSEDDAFLIGSDILVRCHMTPDRDRQVAMPPGVWRRFDFRDQIKGDHLDPDLPELYIRGGSIVPIGPIQEYDGERLLEPLTVLVAFDHRRIAHGGMYEDLGDGYADEEGRHRVVGYTAHRRADTLTIRRSADEGEWNRVARSLRVVLIDHDGVFEGMGLDGQELRIDLTRARRIR